MTYESKCGMICSDCPDKEEFGCLGCLNMAEGYWGEPCEIKQCCDSKNREHCGQCKKFPCDILLDISLDPDTGDDGERIMRCKQWADRVTNARESIIYKFSFGLSAGAVTGFIFGAVQGMIIPWIIAGILIGAGIALMLHISQR